MLDSGKRNWARQIFLGDEDFFRNWDGSMAEEERRREEEEGEEEVSL